MIYLCWNWSQRRQQAIEVTDVYFYYQIQSEAENLQKCDILIWTLDCSRQQSVS